jgi:cell division septation protein DedD
MPGLTRAQMVKVIEGGGSVLVGGEIITDATLLPPEHVLARGDAEREAAAEAELEAQIGSLAAQKAALRRRREEAQARASPPQEPAPAPPPPPEQQRAEQTPPPADEPPPPPREEDDRPGVFGRKKR